MNLASSKFTDLVQVCVGDCRGRTVRELDTLGTEKHASFLTESEQERLVGLFADVPLSTPALSNQGMRGYGTQHDPE